MNIGLEFHTSKKWQAARAAVSSWLILIVIVSFATPLDRPMGILFREESAILFAAFIFLLFSSVLSWTCFRIWRERFVLEFTPTHIVDRRRLRTRKIPYGDIEIFSPRPETIFSPETKIRQIRESFGLRDQIDIACRLRGDGPDFIFSDQVTIPSVSDQEKIVALLRGKIGTFDNLYSDLGDDVGGDASEFDETQS